MSAASLLHVRKSETPSFCLAGRRPDRALPPFSSPPLSRKGTKNLSIGLPPLISFLFRTGLLGEKTSSGPKVTAKFRRMKIALKNCLKIYYSSGMKTFWVGSHKYFGAPQWTVEEE